MASSSEYFLSLPSREIRKLKTNVCFSKVAQVRAEADASLTGLWLEFEGLGCIAPICFDEA